MNIQNMIWDSDHEIILYPACYKLLFVAIDECLIPPILPTPIFLGVATIFGFFKLSCGSSKVAALF